MLATSTVAVMGSSLATMSRLSPGRLAVGGGGGEDAGEKESAGRDGNKDRACDRGQDTHASRR